MNPLLKVGASAPPGPLDADTTGRSRMDRECAVGITRMSGVRSLRAGPPTARSIRLLRTSRRVHGRERGLGSTNIEAVAPILTRVLPTTTRPFEYALRLLRDNGSRDTTFVGKI